MIRVAEPEPLGWVICRTRDGWRPGLDRLFASRELALERARRRGWPTCYVGVLYRTQLPASARAWACMHSVKGIQRALLCPGSEAAERN